MPKCTRCGKRQATELHHSFYVSQGNPDPKGDTPLCKPCHKEVHSQAGDWARWGQKGGLVTASNDRNWKNNLKQFRNRDL